MYACSSRRAWRISRRDAGSGLPGAVVRLARHPHGTKLLMHEAFFFGPSDRQVFATYHPASGGSGQVLTVICPPLFSDYMRTHLALRELAISLAERGQHVLRFDYREIGRASCRERV